MVYNGLTETENYQLAGKTLAANGWGILTAMPEFGTLTTMPRELGNVVVTLNVVCLDRQIKVTGTYTTPGLTTTPMPIVFKGMKGSPAQNAWQHLLNTTLLFGEDLYYN